MVSALSNRQNYTCARITHDKHDKDGGTAPGVRGDSSVPLSHLGNVNMIIGLHTQATVKTTQPLPFEVYPGILKPVLQIRRGKRDN